MADTRIEWATTSWNPVTGCSPVSEGCEHCYARRMATRLAGRCGYPPDEPFRVTIHDNHRDDPLHWRKPRRIFVCSMGDLFHPGVPHGIRQDVVGAARNCPQHKFLILTKRSLAMMRFFRDVAPMPNMWLGVTVEKQRHESRILNLFEMSCAAIRWVSYEPALDALDLKPYLSGLDWVVAGAETGPGARPAHPDWFRAVRDQCEAAGVPFFFKRHSGGSRRLDGLMYEEYPDV